jgi:hypothetical protein
MILNPVSKFKKEKDKVIMQLEFDRVLEGDLRHIIIHNIILDTIKLSNINPYYWDRETKIEFNCLATEKGYWFTEQIIEKEMTLEEIEQKLGYKIKIVNK